MGPARRKASTSIFLRVTSQGLVPTSSYDAEMLAAYPFGTVVEAEVHQPRSPKQERLLRRIVGIVAHNTDKYASGHELMEALKVRLGWTHQVSLIGGGLHFHARSLSEMQGHQLNEFFDLAVQVMCSEVIPGMDARALIRDGRIAVGDPK